MLTLLEHLGYHTSLLEDSLGFSKFQLYTLPLKRGAVTLIAHVSAPLMSLLIWQVAPQCCLISATNTTDSSCTPGEQWLTGS